MSNAEKIQQWRDEHPGERLTAATLQNIIGTDLSDAELFGADLRDADLYRAYMPGADLRFAKLDDADLYHATLYDADFYGASLYGANMYGADLENADMRGAILYGANLDRAFVRGAALRNNRAGLLTIDGAHPYRAELVPTPYGWVLTIGCWNGTVDELRDLIAKDEGWPEATGEEIEKRRPILEAIADFCDAHIDRHAGLIDDLAKRWNS